MKIRTMAWFAGSALVVAMGSIGAAACSSDVVTPYGGLPPAPDGSTGKIDGTTPIGDGAAQGDSPVTPDTDSGDAGMMGDPDCGKVAKLHPATGTGPYCPFQDAGAGTDSGTNCAVGKTCCAPKFPQDTAPQTCIAQGSTCTFAVDGGLQVECEEDNECTGGKVCCVIGTIKQDPGCTNSYGSKINGAFCRTACAAGELHVCQTQAECTTGTCTPFRAAGRDWAACN